MCKWHLQARVDLYFVTNSLDDIPQKIEPISLPLPLNAEDNALV